MLNKNELQYNFYDALVEIENKSNLRKFQNRQFKAMKNCLQKSNVWFDKVIWMNDVINKLDNVDGMNINYELFLNVVNKTHNWKTPKKDKIHKFWIKKFKCAHKYVLNYLNNKAIRISGIFG
jgi:hypothetical protein